MQKNRKKQKNKKKSRLSFLAVLLIFTILVGGVWRLVSDGLVTQRQSMIDEETELVAVPTETVLTKEETSQRVATLDIQKREELDRLELYKGINQYKQTGFIPLFVYNQKPAEDSLLKAVEQISVPLMNQKDFRWAFDTYGDDSGSIIAANGCAVVSLAMIDSYFQNTQIDPGQIADWAGLDHYVTYAGTAFTIYEAFGKERGYNVKEFYDFHEAMEEVKSGNPVVVGINPGYFSSIGHVMVIRGYEDGLVYINDPNDDAASQASLIGHDEEYMIQDGIAYWSFSK